MCLCIVMTETEIFKALADPTRRAVFERLADGERNATELREGLAISQPAMSQHLAVLRSAGLVAEQRSGRNVNYQVNPEGLALMFRWLQRYRVFWPERVEALKQLLKEMDQ
ncbi:MAG TPA: metalloregulator ArsR/SmtB family transcription factor [Roseiarcus sp.]|jgi:DNA-binding transcriptional ArsR family regulator